MLVLLAPLAACGRPLEIQSFAGAGPQFDPVVFWTGHSHSTGVIENRFGEPIERVTTDCIGEAEGADGLNMRQTLTMGNGTVQSRDWHMRRTAPGHFEATANDMIGTAMGEAAGPAFHWRWGLATKPGNLLFDVTMHQWMYEVDDRTMVNRTVITKLGVTLAEVTETFRRDNEP